MADRRTAEEIAAYYEEIRTAHRAAEERYRRTMHYYRMAVLENTKAREAGGLSDPDLERYYEEQARLIQQHIRKYYSMLPCDAFAKRFGWLFHEAYKAKYPIYAATKVEDVDWLPAGPSWTFVVPEPLNMMKFTADPSLPPPITTSQYTVPIEAWSWDGRWRVRLAYANEIDTVLVFPLRG